jgi:hypothetical protein
VTARVSVLFSSLLDSPTKNLHVQPNAWPPRQTKVPCPTGLFDPKGRHTLLKASQAFHRFEMCVPPVFTADGYIVVPDKLVRGNDPRWIFGVVSFSPSGGRQNKPSSSNGKKRRLEMGPLQSQTSKRRPAVVDEMILCLNSPTVQCPFCTCILESVRYDCWAVSAFRVKQIRLLGFSCHV